MGTRSIHAPSRRRARVMNGAALIVLRHLTPATPFPDRNARRESLTRELVEKALIHSDCARLEIPSGTAVLDNFSALLNKNVVGSCKSRVVGRYRHDD